MMMSLQASSTLAVRQTARIMALKALAARGGAYRSASHYCSAPGGARGIHSVHRLERAVCAVQAEGSSNFKAGSIDLNKLFDEVDNDSDGSINKHEFLSALKLVQYDGILKTQADAKDELDRLSKKMETVERLEHDMADLLENSGSTAADSNKVKRDDIKSAINELKAQIITARATFNTLARQH